MIFSAGASRIFGWLAVPQDRESLRVGDLKLLPDNTFERWDGSRWKRMEPATPSPSLAEFLLKRIDEDEEVAKAAAFGYGARWTNEDDEGEGWSVVHADGQRDMVGCEDPDVPAHIARHDPDRVLAECESRRLIVEHIQFFSREAMGDTVLRYLGTPYAGHPDFRPEWLP